MIRVSSFGQLTSPLRDKYIHRIQKMIPFEWIQIDIKRMPNLRSVQPLPEESKFLEQHPHFVLVDVTGKAVTSQEFYELCFQKNNATSSKLHLVIGPAIGFHEEFFKRASQKISLSSLTFTHELAQIVLAESLYRASCQLKNHPFVK